MGVANVKLSKKELLLVCDEAFILTKNLIIEKVYQLFGELSNRFVNIQKNEPPIFPGEVFTASPKIYKGEQYRGLPYVLLDCPRLFIKEEIFAIRCFFWWGNFFSITLHLAGRYAETYTQVAFKALQKNKNSDWHVCVSDKQWEHHFEVDNYLPVTSPLINSAGAEEILKKRFFKMAKKIPLKQWDDATDFFEGAFEEIIEMLKTAT